MNSISYRSVYFVYSSPYALLIVLRARIVAASNSAGERNVQWYLIVYIITVWLLIAELLDRGLRKFLHTLEEAWGDLLT